ncbi:MAG TPA: hypothetical protein VF553_20580 [Pyrinomonadaceae bacterium]|jgi:hypothetical protein
MEAIFGRDGLIARAHPEYEYRPGQIEKGRAMRCYVSLVPDDIF